ncbi:hypothetical protein HYFRA_00003942 [Hymenoscyphus fraxineus]|uniref:Uncharacterized protein n=1 Tax=Hymenoscyphus fraxineus TaxID=746836 RepID=A0A9N9L1H3_9HELO|nr:hypothetical protein HYFRA_00003942 [Hymenoscyphus fraxineus]
MFIKNIILLATTASLAAAQEPSKKIFTLAVAQPNGDLDGQPINAFETFFYTGLPEPKTANPTDQPIPANSAPMTVFVGTPDFLHVQVPGGQQTFVPPQGPLTFTEANKNTLPPSGLQGGWVNSTFSNREGTPLYELMVWDKPESGRGVALCPSAIPNALQVFVKTPGFSRSDCTDILGFKAIPYVEDGFGAFQYV